MKFVSVIFAFFLGDICFANFVPPNDLFIEDTYYRYLSPTSEETYLSWLEEAKGKTIELVEQHGAQLNVVNAWHDPKVNASAGQVGNLWSITMYGGLARRPEITKDGFHLIYCHELGHHIGGYPFFKDSIIASMSIEGQSDYYSSGYCTKRLWRDEASENAQAEDTVHPTAKRKCDYHWKENRGRHLCYRTANAIQSVMDLFDYIDPSQPSSFDDEDTSEVSETTDLHPEHQCRLDTMLAAALCPVNFDHQKIPGKEVLQGAHSREAELEAAHSSCMQAEGRSTGFRPRCWFKGQSRILAGVQQLELIENHGNHNGIPEPGETFTFLTTLRNFSHSSIFNSVTKLNLNQNHLELVSGELEAQRSNWTAQDSLVLSPQVKIKSQLECGDKINLPLVFSGVGDNETAVTFFELGELKEGASFNSRRSVDIPDLNRFGQHARSSISVEELSSIYDRVIVDIDVNHQNASNLLGQLVSASGKTYTAFPQRALNGERVRKQFHIKLDEKEGEGRWKLKVFDVVPTHHGRLVSWKLTFAERVCEVF